MKFYVCSMANEGRGRPVELLTENVALLEKFAEDHYCRAGQCTAARTH